MHSIKVHQTGSDGLQSLQAELLTTSSAVEIRSSLLL